MQLLRKMCDTFSHCDTRINVFRDVEETESEEEKSLGRRNQRKKNGAGRTMMSKN